jgi:hypothetical protein
LPVPAKCPPAAVANGVGVGGGSVGAGTAPEERTLRGNRRGKEEIKRGVQGVNFTPLPASKKNIKEKFYEEKGFFTS